MYVLGDGNEQRWIRNRTIKILVMNPVQDVSDLIHIQLWFLKKIIKQWSYLGHKSKLTGLSKTCTPCKMSNSSGVNTLFLHPKTESLIFLSKKTLSVPSYFMSEYFWCIPLLRRTCKLFWIQHFVLHKWRN